MTKWIGIPLTVVVLLTCSASRADVYVLGSSYSNDARPDLLDDSPLWHIDCGKPLQFIHDNPLAPCLSTSTIWPVALNATRFDYVSFQPVAGPGISQQSDLDAIGHWMSLQPGTVGVIHTTWPRPSIFESTFHEANPDHTLTNYSREYYRMLDYWAVSGCSGAATIRGLSPRTRYKISAIAVPQIVPGSSTGVLPSFLETRTVRTRGGWAKGKRRP